MPLKTKRLCPAFTLVELLMVIAVLGILFSILLPALGRARRQAYAVVCRNNLRQFGLALRYYADDFDGYALPAHEPADDTYWWGQKLPDRIDHDRGFIQPYLSRDHSETSVYECPAQPFGTYLLQGKPPEQPDHPKWITSTYGYNGYYLCPPKSAWPNIKHRPWKKLESVIKPNEVLAFADTMIDWDQTRRAPRLSNCALLDPPYILSNNQTTWEKNPSPTTSFRHDDLANVVMVNGSCKPMDLIDGQYSSPLAQIGSVGKNNAPYYVPDYLQWPQNRRRRTR